MRAFDSPARLAFFIGMYMSCTLQLVQAAQVVVGQVGPMSGLEANQGRANAAGLELYFSSVNKAGGVNGHGFTLVRKDDGGRPEVTASATKQLLAEERPLVLAGTLVAATSAS